MINGATCKVDPTILVSAARYALGRRTYIVSETTEAIESNIANIPLKLVAVIVRDINECKDLGDQCDIDAWKNCLALLKERLEESRMS